MIVDINEMQRIITALLLKLRDNEGNEIEIKSDFFWDISEKELYNPYHRPTDITLGQISFDLEQIERLSDSDEYTMYDLKRISNILKVLSWENPTAF